MDFCVALNLTGDTDAPALLKLFTCSPVMQIAMSWMLFFNVVYEHEYGGMLIEWVDSELAIHINRMVTNASHGLVG